MSSYPAMVNRVGFSLASGALSLESAAVFGKASVSQFGYAPVCRRYLGFQLMRIGAGSEPIQNARRQRVNTSWVNFDCSNRTAGAACPVERVNSKSWLRALFAGVDEAHEFSKVKPSSTLCDTG